MRLIDQVNRAKKRLVIPMMGFPGLQLSKTTIKENLTNGKEQFKTLNLLVEKTKPDGIFTFMDVTVEWEAITGMEISYPEKDPPAIKVHPIQKSQDLKFLKVPDPYKDGRMPVYLECVKLLSENLDILTGAYILGPFTLAGQLAGHDKLILSTKSDPEFANLLLDFTSKVLKKYAVAIFDAGADMVMVLEATGMLLSPKLFELHAGKYVKQIIDNINKPFILHICGDAGHLVEKMCAIGTDGISLDKVDLSRAIKTIPDDMVLMGNLHPTKVALSTNEEIAQASYELLETMKNYKNFILSSGCELPPGTPIENIIAMIEAARCFEA